MSVKDIISTHPHFNAVLQSARTWMRGTAIPQRAEGYEKSLLEHVLVGEMLNLIDISVPGAGASNINLYLKGDIDQDGRYIDRGVGGLFRHLENTAMGKVTNLASLIALGDQHRKAQPLSPHIVTASQFINRATQAAGIKITNEQIGAAAFKIAATGATTDDEFGKEFNKLMLNDNPCMFVITQDNIQVYQKVMEEVYRLLDVNGFYRLDFQIRAYTAEIMVNTAGTERTDKEIGDQLDMILVREKQAMTDSVEFKRVLSEVTRQIHEGGMVRTPEQLRKYAETIHELAAEAVLTEHDIYAALQRIIYQESEVANKEFVIGQKPDPFADLNPGQKSVAKEIRRLLAIQRESWTMGKIRDLAVKLWNANEKDGGPSGRYIADRIIMELEGDNRKPVRNIGEDEVVLHTATLINDKDLNTLLAKDNTAHQEPVKAFEVDDHYRYTRNDVQHTIAREYGQTPEGNPLMGAWVIREFFTGNYIDHDRHRTDLAERHAIKLE